MRFCGIGLEARIAGVNGVGSGGEIPGEDVVRHRGDAVLIPQTLAEGQHESRLPGPDGSASSVSTGSRQELGPNSSNQAEAKPSKANAHSRVRQSTQRCERQSIELKKPSTTQIAHRTVTQTEAETPAYPPMPTVKARSRQFRPSTSGISRPKYEPGPSRISWEWPCSAPPWGWSCAWVEVAIAVERPRARMRSRVMMGRE